MNTVKDSVNDLENVSSDGEEDFESADEGEGKEKDGTRCEGNVHRNDNAPGDSNETGNVTSACLSDEMKTIPSDEPSQIEDTDNNLESSREQSVDSNIMSSDKNNMSKAQEYDDITPQPYDPEEVSSTPNAALNVVVSSEDSANKQQNVDNTVSQSNTSSAPEESPSSSWGWGSWGAVLNQATNTMTSGLSQVIEKVETTLGIPEPGELQDEAFPKDEKNEVITMEPRPSEIDRDVEESSKNDADSSAQESFFSSWGLTSLSNAVTSKGLQMVSEGIDALETIGKKTMDVISEGDPGFREKRGMFNKPSLSQVLREAKEESAKLAAEKKTQEVLEKVNFNDEFDRYQGLAHLEALEILSRECETKIESMLIDLSEDDLEKAKTKLRAIEDVFGKASTEDENHDESTIKEFAVEIGQCAMALNLAFVPNKLNQTEEMISKWLDECMKDQEKSASSRLSDDIYSHVVTSLADITAKSIEVFRKVAEMILLADDKDNSVTAEERATHLYSITNVVTNRISSLSTSYAQCLNTAVNETEDKDNDNITPLITEVYLECSNSSSHVQDAFKLLLPVLQVSSLNNMK